MRRVFLSHSSKDKERYLRPLLDKLSKDAGTERFVYDEVTFEAGLENEELIIDWLSRSDLFVLFLSNDSLNSSWVKKEILEASDLQSLGQIKKIYPIIIDPSITHEDRRIPDWMRDTYNLRFVSKPAVAARKIISMMREISWKQTPKLKEKQQFFVGRNDLISISVFIYSFIKSNRSENDNNENENNNFLDNIKYLLYSFYGSLGFDLFWLLFGESCSGLITLLSIINAAIKGGLVYLFSKVKNNKNNNKNNNN